MNKWAELIPCSPNFPISRIALLVLTIAVSYVGWYVLESLSPFGASCELRLDVKIPAGNRIEAYFNGAGYPIVAQRTTGERTTMVLKGAPAYINSLRLDLSELAGVPIDIFGVAIESGGQVIEEFSPAYLRGALSLQGAVFDTERASHSYVSIRTVTNDPIISWSPRVASASHLAFVRKLPFKGGSQSLALLCFCLAILVVLGWWSSQLLSVSCVLLTGLAWAVLYVHACSDLPEKFLSTDMSVGQASYSGYPKGTEFLLYQRSLLLIFITGLVAGILVRLLRSYLRFGRSGLAVRSLISFAAVPETAIIERTPHFVARMVVDSAFLAMLTLYYFFLMFPGLSSVLESLQRPLVSNIGLGGFDGSNVFTWCALRIFGFMPHRDYWFPYAGFYDALYDTPMDLFRNHLHTSLVWGVVLFGVYRLTNCSKLSALAASLLMMLMLFNGLLGAHSRYLMSIGLVLLASNCFLISARPFNWVLFGSYAGYVLGQEPHQLIYSSLALAFIFVIGYPRWKVAGLRMVCCVSLSAAMSVMFWFVRLMRARQLEGFTAFFLRADGMLSSVAVPSDISRWIMSPVGVDAILFWGGMALILLSLYLVVSGLVQRELYPLVITALAIGLLFSVVFTKQLVRPHIATQLVVVPVFGFLLLVLAWSQTWRWKQWLLCAACFGLLMSHLDLSAFGPMKLMKHSRRIASLKPDIAVAMDRQIRSQVVEEKLYSLEKFAEAAPFLPELSAIIDRDALTDGIRPLVYVLGDESFVYPVIRQQSPRFITFYDGSDIRAQMETISWLGVNQPKYVLWNPSVTSFDGVPNVVRVPRIFSYLVQRYRFEGSIRGMHLLIRKDSSKEPQTLPADIGYWSNNLGSELVLGSIPALSSIRDREMCTPGSVAFCEPVIRVDLKNKATIREPIRIELRRGKETYSIVFFSQPKRRSYSVKVASVWFLANSTIRDWDIRCSSNSTACNQVRVEHRRFPVPQLY